MVPDPAGPFYSLDVYSQKLTSLVAHLHSKYFPDDPSPFDESSPTVMTQTQIQSQSQSVHVEMIIQITEMITRKIDKYEDGSKEKTFLQKIRGCLSGVKDIAGLITLIMTTGQDMKMTLDEIAKLFM